MRLSSLIKTYKRENVVCLYHPYTLQKIFVDEKLFKKIQSDARNVDPAVLIDLSRRGLLVPDDFDESKFIDDFRRQHGQSCLEITICYLVHTCSCNFACRYCQSVSSHEHSEMMSIETAQRGIDLFVKHTEKIGSELERKLVHYGGEPLLNYRVLKEATLYAKEQLRMRGIDLETVVVTNGSLITNEMARFFRDEGIWACVSLDGFKQIHDSMRVDWNGQGTFAEVIRGLETLRSYDCNILIACTVGQHNLNYLCEIVKFCHKELGIQGLKFNPVSLPPEGIGIEEPEPKELGQKLIEAFKVAREQGIYEDTIMKRVKAFVESKFYAKACGAVGNELTIFPNSLLVPCHALVLPFLPKVFMSGSTDLEKDPLFLEWSSRLPLNMKECEKCEAIAICGGGCPFRSFIHEGTIWARDKRACELARQLLKWLIWDLYDKTEKDLSST